MSLLWITTPLAAAAAVLFVVHLLRWKEKCRVLSEPGEPYSLARFTVVEPDGSTWPISREEESFSFGTTARSSITLPKSKFHDSTRPTTFSCMRTGTQIVLTARKPILINGVAHKKHELKHGDKIVFDDFRIIFDGTVTLVPEPPPLPRPAFAFLSLPIAALITIGILFPQPIRFPTRPHVSEGPPAPPAELPHAPSTKLPEIPTGSLVRNRAADAVAKLIEKRTIPEKPVAVEPETATVGPETVAVAPETVAVAPEPAAVAPETVAVAPEPAAVAPEPAAIAPETAAVAPETAAVAPETAAVAPEPAAVAPETAETTTAAALPEHELSGQTAPEDIAPGGAMNTGFITAEPVSKFAQRPVQVFGPGETPAYFDADIMFIHAHPDDEAIDFGGLMAMMARSGKRIVTIIFTDGESGLDIYPRRFVNDEYPAHDLTGKSLAAVRKDELKRSLTVLGSEQLVRLGLHNNPYSGASDVLSVDEVLDSWGGVALEKKLIDLITGYTPDVIISPDGPNECEFEHFEHEAVGSVVSRVVNELVSSGRAKFLTAYLVSIDPKFVDEFPKALNVDVTTTDPATGRTFRAIQIAALKQHITQRDATIIAVDHLADYPFEHYLQVFPNADTKLAGLFD